MVMLRQQSQTPEDEARLNVLLTVDRQRASGHWSRQLPRLLGPQGVRAFVAETGQEAVRMAGSIQIHTALVDLATPTGHELGRGSSGGLPGGIWLLEVLRRLPSRPAVVVVNNLISYSPKQAQRFLNEALRLGAFTVMNTPIDIEALLVVIRRIVDRHFQGQWPISSVDERAPSNGPEL